MSAAHDAAVEEARSAELAGDWPTAFERHRSVPMFAESHHGARLHVLTSLGDDAPTWLVTRFLTAMAQRLEMITCAPRQDRALRLVVPLLYPHGVQLDLMGCEHPEQVPSRIYGRDWVLRQVDVYDLGALRELTELPEARGALRRGGLAADWVHATMGGYRIVGADGEVMVVADALTGEELDLLDLGLTEQHEPGTHVLGRVVPSGASPARMFDVAPLPVDARIAREVGARPERWLDVVASRTRSGALPPGFSHLAETSMSADLPMHSWTALLGHAIGEVLPRHPSTMVDEALKVALRLLEPELRRQRHLVAELLLDELADERLIARFATGPYVDSWRRLVGVLPPVARPLAEQGLWLSEACATDDLAG